MADRLPRAVVRHGATLQLRLPGPLVERLRKHSQTRNVTQAAITRLALEMVLDIFEQDPRPVAFQYGLPKAEDLAPLVAEAVMKNRPDVQTPRRLGAEVDTEAKVDEPPRVMTRATVVGRR